MRFSGMQLVSLIGAAAIAAACSNSTNNGATTTFEGVIAGDSASGQLSGQISLTVAAASLSVSSPAVFDITGTDATAATVNVTGTLKIMNGATVQLSGTYDTGTHGLTVSGGGYSFTGTFSNGGISGTFTTPSGGGGSFSTSSTSGGGAVYSFCGTAVATSAQGGGATFNLVINTAAGTAKGYASSNDGITSLNGTAASSSWSISFVTVKQGDPGTASGSFTSSSLTGTYSIPNQGESGTVNGTICQ